MRDSTSNKPRRAKCLPAGGRVDSIVVVNVEWDDKKKEFVRNA
jgi:hypothetical protein